MKRVQIRGWGGYVLLLKEKLKNLKQHFSSSGVNTTLIGDLDGSRKSINGTPSSAFKCLVLLAKHTFCQT